jgi:RHH-type proline utilization regulon transcriptional repressor/proline dehydrogenase/delta 1-pyrroline-5-carboxylate dehydrogenase
MNWDDLDGRKYAAETEDLAVLQRAFPLSAAERKTVRAEAEALVVAARDAQARQGVVESFLQEFSLDTREGLALMCLAEALLRTPDNEGRDRLIAEKIGAADWARHVGNSDSLFVNATTWGLMLTGRLVDLDVQAKQDFPGFLTRIAGRLGEPVIRAAVTAAIGIMGEQFVLGRTIDAALTRAAAENLLCSFDMLGEGARSAEDAERYEQAYANAIDVVGAQGKGAGPERGHAVSVKLSALSPRYEAVQEKRVWAELYPRLLRLCRAAARHDINLTVDAEEADRLVLSLKILDRLCAEPDLAAWRGLGLAVQAYQKRGRDVIASLTDLARRRNRRLMVRLVKGAYWDSEIKRAQIAGLPGYPVYTTKAATDLSYLVCAKALLSAAPHLYAQIATHNAHTLAAVRAMAARDSVAVEFQRLHGMGEVLYRAAQDSYGPLTVRTYAPVGQHEDLLPYLVRRLLENGANTSFVNSLLNRAVTPAQAVSDPFDAVAANPGPNPKIPVPRHIYGRARTNSAGVDLSSIMQQKQLRTAVEALDNSRLASGPIIGGKLKSQGSIREIVSPADHRRIVGVCRDASQDDIESAFSLARRAQPAWDAAGGAARAAVLRAAADAIEAKRERLIALLSREAGKTLPDGVSEVREAADFCRYYADLAEKQFNGPQRLTGPVGETNTLELHGRGVFACISPWNFPAAIFTGQIAAALAAGNAVLAKPAEQTPLIAALVVELFHGVGLDPGLLALLPGDGATVGAALIAHPSLDGVAFTGGTDTAWQINRTLAARRGTIVPLIAETGGLNGMFVDTTAMREQVIDDAVLSAMGSAGQRCSALRLLFLPDEIADAMIHRLRGAMDALVIGDPADPGTDIGPVIDAAAKEELERHVRRLESKAKVLHRLRVPDSGTFFAPTLSEIPSADFLEREVFGPILHIVRYEPGQFETAARGLAALGYGLTLGVHSRIDAFAEDVVRLVPAGNVYVNRSMIGAVVGVQPFGGQGLSGTGPKAGGPHSLLRFATERAVSTNIAAQGGDPSLFNL